MVCARDVLPMEVLRLAVLEAMVLRDAVLRAIEGRLVTDDFAERRRAGLVNNLFFSIVLLCTRFCKSIPFLLPAFLSIVRRNPACVVRPLRSMHGTRQTSAAICHT